MSPVIQKYKYLLFYTILGILLVVPLGLKFIAKANKLEVYPSIVLPTGATLLESNSDYLVYKRVVVLAKSQKTNSLEELKIKDFLSPIPKHYLFAIYDNDFGLNLEKKNKISFRTSLIKEFYFRNNKSFTPSMIDQTKKWYQEKLKNLGFSTEVFIAKTLEYTVNISTEKTVKIETLEEKRYELD